jgi:hypothetical protein
MGKNRAASRGGIFAFLNRYRVMMHPPGGAFLLFAKRLRIVGSADRKEAAVFLFRHQFIQGFHITEFCGMTAFRFGVIINDAIRLDKMVIDQYNIDKISGELV